MTNPLPAPQTEAVTYGPMTATVRPLFAQTTTPAAQEAATTKRKRKEPTVAAGYTQFIPKPLERLVLPEFNPNHDVSEDARYIMRNLWAMLVVGSLVFGCIFSLFIAFR